MQNQSSAEQQQSALDFIESKMFTYQSFQVKFI